MDELIWQKVRGIVRRVIGRVERTVHMPSEFEGRPIQVSGEVRLKYTLFGGRAIAAEYGELLGVIEEFVKPEDVVWDVGSNVGVFAIAAASRAGSKASVIAFEPDLYLCGLMRRSLSHGENSDLQVTVLPVAVAEEVGIKILEISDTGRTGNRVIGTTAEAVAEGERCGRESTMVPCFSLDCLLAHLPAPDLLKIDVEGGEVDVMSGAERMVTEVRPVIYCEVRPRHSEELTQRFRQVNYSLFEYDHELGGKKPIDTCSFNTLAIPNERTTDNIVSMRK